MRLLVGVLAGVVVAEAVLFAQIISRGWGLGADAWFYMDLGQKWLDTGQWYYPFQFEPHTFTNMLDNVYPPTALPLFVAGAIAPWPLWWIVPIAVTVAAIRHFRPGPWTIAAILVLLMWPRSIGGYLYGNTTMWTTAFLAAGLAWGYPMALIAIKPSVMFWGVLGIRDRRAWIGAAVVAGVSLLMLPLWLDYIDTIRATTGTAYWVALFDIPPMLIGAVAWLSHVLQVDNRMVRRRVPDLVGVGYRDVTPPLGSSRVDHPSA